MSIYPSWTRGEYGQKWRHRCDNNVAAEGITSHLNVSTSATPFALRFARRSFHPRCESTAIRCRRYGEGKKYRFESAEGCYSYAVLQRDDIRVKYAVKAMTDFNKADPAQEHGIMLAERRGGGEMRRDERMRDRRLTQQRLLAS